MVRKDLPQSQIVVQAAHAAIESARKFLLAKTEHPHLVVCGVENEEELLKCEKHLDAKGILATIFHEEDRNNEATALASEPVFCEQRKIFRRYRLLT